MTTKEQAYAALAHAAEQMGLNNYLSGLYRPVRRRGKVVSGYSLTADHAALVEAMPRVLSGAMGIEEAMALVTSPAVMRERFPA